MPLSYPTTFIYTLTDPRTGVVRYVGKSDNPKKRLGSHLRESRVEKSCHRHDWINSLQSAGLIPILSIIEECPRDAWAEREIHWIAFYRATGNDLTNNAAGGVGPSECVVSEESRKRMSAARKGKTESLETRNRKSVALKGRLPHSDTYAAQGKHYIATSPEGEDIEVRNLTAFCQERGIETANLHKCINGKYPSHNGWRLRYPGEPLRELTGRRGGIPWTEERKKAFSEYQTLHTPLRGKPLLPETIAKQKAAKMANPITLERRAQIADSRSKNYIITDSEGTEIVVRNLTAFCRDRALSLNYFRNIIDGKPQKYKGWRIRRPD